MIACIAAGFGCLFAQDTRTVKGVVISSEDNLPVIGAAVMEKGTKNATMTDIDGKSQAVSENSGNQLPWHEAQGCGHH